MINPFTLLGGAVGTNFKKLAKEKGEQAAKKIVRTSLKKKFTDLAKIVEADVSGIEGYLTKSTPDYPDPYQFALADLQFRLYHLLFGGVPLSGDLADEFRDRHKSRVYAMCRNKLNEKTEIKDVLALVIECEMSILL
jgi:hypothetical protein